MIAQSKRVRVGSLAIVDQPQAALTCILRVFGLQMSGCLSLVFRLFCFLSRLYAFSLKPRPFVQSFFDMYGPRQPHAVTKQLPASFFVFVCFFFFVYLEMSLFPNIFVLVAFSLCIENKYMVCSPPLPDDVFLPCDERLFFLHQLNLLCDNPINQAIKLQIDEEEHKV